jgi:hypothetical protein
LGSSLSWILFEEDTPRLTARGDKKRLGVTSPTLSCRAIARHPSLRSGRRPSSLCSGRRPKDAKERGLWGALSRLGIANKVILDDEALLEIRGG